MAKKYSNANYKNWKVKVTGRSDGVRPAMKNLKNKRKESELIAEQTKVFLENGGKIKVYEQDFCTDILKLAHGKQKGAY